MSSFTKILLLLLLYLTGFCLRLEAQFRSQTTQGRTFWIGFMQNQGAGPLTAAGVNLSVFISAERNTTGTLSIPAQPGGSPFRRDFEVPANSTIEIRIEPANLAQAVGSEVIGNFGVLVETQGNVTVSALNHQRFTQDATRILPVERLSSEYVVAAYYDQGQPPIDALSSQMLIVATENGTVVEIIPSVQLSAARPAGRPFTVTLNRGQTYQIQARADLTGTRVRSLNCRPIAVFGGARASNVGGTGTANHLYEQIPPVRNWGRNYFYVPFAERRGGDIIRIVAAYNNTTIRFNGAQPLQLNAGAVSDPRLLTTNTYIEADKPIMVIQYSRGNCVDCGNCNCFNSFGIGDPAMLILQHHDVEPVRFVSFETPNIRSFDRHYVTIITRTKTVNSVRINNIPVLPQNFVPFRAAPDYAFAQLEVRPGYNTVYGDSGVVVYAYGWGEREAYALSTTGEQPDLSASAQGGLNFCVNTIQRYRVNSYAPISSVLWDFGDGGFANTPTVDNKVYRQTGVYAARVIVRREGFCRPDTFVGTVIVNGPDARITDVKNIGCQTGNVGAINLTPSGGQWRQDSVFVSATIEGVGTGIRVEPGQRISIIPREGRWCSPNIVGGLSCTSGEGEPPGAAAPLLYLPSSNFMALIGRIGNDRQTAFVIGKGQTYTVPPGVSGELVLLANDAPTAYGDNRSGLIVDIFRPENARYQYRWSNGATTEDLTNLDAGTYTVTVTDPNGCVATTSAQITRSQPLEVSVLSATPPTCVGLSNGTITIGVEPRLASLTYTWSHSTTVRGPIAAGLNAGTYTVTVRDVSGCTATVSHTLEAPNALDLRLEETKSVSCFGANNGVITARASGGTGTLRYTWRRNGVPLPNTTPVLENAAAGLYTVTATDVNGCSALRSLQTVEPLPIIPLPIVGNISCNGAKDGSIILITLGGTEPYRVLWSNQAVTPNLSNLSAGSYTATITDGRGCTTSTGRLVVNEPPRLSVRTVSTNLAVCNAEVANGALAVVSGGVLPYSFVWNTTPTTTTPNLTNVPPGRYTVTVTDGNNCTAIDSVTLNRQDLLQLIVEETLNPSCFGRNNGRLTVISTGGQPTATNTYTFRWAHTSQTFNNTNSLTLENLRAATYTVTVTDSRFCTTSAEITLTQPLRLTVRVTGTTGLACNADANGRLTATPSGGTPDYRYRWSNGDSTATTTGLEAQSYTVTVTDRNGCTVTAVQTLTQPVVLRAIMTVTDVLCHGDANGRAVVATSGGITPYRYTWSDGTATTPSRIGLRAGTYTVTITDANGCSALTFARILQPQNPVRITLNSQSSNLTFVCGQTDLGIIATNVSGGTEPYTFVWSNGRTSQSLQNLPGGTYTVTVIDARNCQDSLTTTVNAPPPIVIREDSIINPRCARIPTGSIYTTVSGGVGRFRYQWVGRNETREDLTGLYAGIYTLSVTDEVGCFFTRTFTVSGPDSVDILTLRTVAPSCPGQPTGLISIGTRGGTPPFRTTWATNGAVVPLYNNRQLIDGLLAGTYTVTLTDANGCTTSRVFTLSQPAALTVTPTVTNLTCFGSRNGTIRLGITGGNTPYRVLWSTQDTGLVINNLSAITYSFTVTDGSSCTTTGRVNLTQPPALLAAPLVKTDVRCAGATNGALSVNPQGGRSPYTYRWSNNATTANLTNLGLGTYTLTLTDANSCTATASATLTQPAALGIRLVRKQDLTCANRPEGSVVVEAFGGTPNYRYNWSNGSTTNQASNLIAANHTVTVTDAAACTSTLAVRITSPDTLKVRLTPTNVLCAGANTGIIASAVTGGKKPYRYQWSLNGSNVALNQDTLKNVAAGNYTVIVVDSNGCVVRSPTVNITQPPYFNVRFGAVSNINCHGANTGEINVLGDGGVPNYVYTWQHNGQPITTLRGSRATNLQPGFYTVNVVDLHGCERALTTTLTQPAPIKANPVVESVRCAGEPSGSIKLYPTGGFFPYVYTWADDSTVTESRRSFLFARDYTVTITDAKGCTLVQEIAIQEPAALTIVVQGLRNVDCYGDKTGEILLSVGCGVGPYQYLWNDGAKTRDRKNLGAGTYTITVFDKNECSASLEIEVEQHPPLNLVLLAPETVPVGSRIATITAVGSGGSLPATYSLNGGPFQSDSVFRNLAAGLYQVKMRDERGCMLEASIEITQPSCLMTAELIAAPNVCPDSLGSIKLTIFDGYPPFSIVWSNRVTNRTELSGLKGGVYSVTVTDSLGCSLVQDVLVAETGAVEVIATVMPVGCEGISGGSISLEILSGKPPFLFTWSSGATSQNLTNVSAGEYEVLVTDSARCQGRLQVTVGETPPLQVIRKQRIDPGCTSDRDGVVEALGFGGTPPYTYEWTQGLTTPRLTELGLGTYDVVVTDARGCVAVERFELIQTLFMTMQLTGIQGFGSNGQISVNAEGGTRPYRYAINGGELVSDSVFTGLAPGFYTVKVVEHGGCSRTDTLTLRALPCPKPGTIRLFARGRTTATLDWTGVQGATRYLLQYRPANGQVWTTLRTTTPNLVLQNLRPNTRYEVRVRTECGANQLSAFSDTFLFVTNP